MPAARCCWGNEEASCGEWRGRGRAGASQLLPQHTVATAVKAMLVLWGQLFSRRRCWFLFQMKNKKWLPTSPISSSFCNTGFNLVNTRVPAVEGLFSERITFLRLSTTPPVTLNTQYKPFSPDVFTALDHPFLPPAPDADADHTESTLKGKWALGCNWTWWKTPWLTK